MARGAACCPQGHTQGSGLFCMRIYFSTSDQATVIWTHSCETDVWQLFRARTFRDEERGV